MGYDKRQVGKHLQAIRKEAGFKSARAFAEHVGINVNTYTDFEQGNRPLSFERAWQLADALHCSLDELGGRPWPSSAPQTSEVMSEDEWNLVENYRDTHDYFKPEIAHFAADQADRHPKNETDSNSGRNVEKGA